RVLELVDEKDVELVGRARLNVRACEETIAGEADQIAEPEGASGAPPPAQRALHLADAREDRARIAVERLGARETPDGGADASRPRPRAEQDGLAPLERGRARQLVELLARLVDAEQPRLEALGVRRLRGEGAEHVEGARVTGMLCPVIADGQSRPAERF